MMARSEAWRSFTSLTIAPLRTALSAAPVLTYAPVLLLSTVVGYVVVMALSQVFFTSAGYDDSYHGTIARNLVEGRGYVTAYGEVVQKLNPMITVGPALILPAALFHGTLGSHYWVNNLIVPLVTLPLLGAIIWLLIQRFRVKQLTVALMLVMLLLFTTERTANGEMFRFMFLWSHLMGDIPAALAAVLAVMLVCLNTPDRRVHLLAGVCLGLAFYMKVFVVYTVPGLVLLYAWTTISERRIAMPFLFAGGVLLVAAPFELFKLTQLGSWDAYVSNTQSVIGFYRGWDKLSVGNDDFSTIGSLTRQLSIHFAVVPLLAWIGLLGLDRARSLRVPAEDQPRARLAAVMLCAASIHIAWWLLFNDAGWVRHAMPAAVYLVFGLGAAAELSPTPVLRYAGVAVFAVLLMSQVDAIGGLTPRVDREPRLTALLNTSSYMESIRSEDTSFWGCGWWANRDLTMAGGHHFYDCNDDASVARHMAAGERILLVRSEFYNWDNNAKFGEVAADCDERKLFANGPFVICDATPWFEARVGKPSS